MKLEFFAHNFSNSIIYTKFEFLDTILKFEFSYNSISLKRIPLVQKTAHFIKVIEKNLVKKILVPKQLSVVHFAQCLLSALHHVRFIKIPLYWPREHDSNVFLTLFLRLEHICKIWRMWHKINTTRITEQRNWLLASPLNQLKSMYPISLLRSLFSSFLLSIKNMIFFGC